MTRSVSSHSQSNDDDYNDRSDDDDDGSDGDSEFLSKDDLKMFGNKAAAKIVPDDNDIVSDIYSTAFSKVPKVRAKTT